MKYEKIRKMFKEEEVGARMAVKVYRAQPFVRKAVNKWMEDGDVPDLMVEIAPEGLPEGASKKLSVHDLIDVFGLETLDAFLFIDWATGSDEGSFGALSYLAYNRTRPFEMPPVTAEELERMDPELREAYEEKLAEERKKCEEEVQLYNKIKEEEIYD